jgi:hypothetical protein
VLALLCFAPIAVAFALHPFTGVPWWRAIPLGGVERLLALVEVITVVYLGYWAIRATAPTPADARTPADAARTPAAPVN